MQCSVVLEHLAADFTGALLCVPRFLLVPFQGFGVGWELFATRVAAQVTAGAGFGYAGLRTKRPLMRGQGLSRVALWPARLTLEGKELVDRHKTVVQLGRVDLALFGVFLLDVAQ